VGNQHRVRHGTTASYGALSITSCLRVRLVAFSNRLEPRFLVVRI
jgi:hypothetical protein